MLSVGRDVLTMVILGDRCLEARQVMSARPDVRAVSTPQGPRRAGLLGSDARRRARLQVAAGARRAEARNASEKHSSSPSPLAMKAGTAASTILTEPHT